MLVFSRKRGKILINREAVAKLQAHPVLPGEIATATA
jgi:hypothetical protein